MRSCSYYLWALRHLRPCLSLDVAKTMAASVAGLCLDYCNALFYSVTQSTMNKLQRVQNSLARVICDVGWRPAHSADFLHDLYWLPVCKQVMFKAASLCYRSCRFGQPAYLPLASYIPARHLRLSNSDRLNEPPARWTTFQSLRATHLELCSDDCQIRWQLRLLQGPATDSSVWHCLTLMNVA